MNTSRVVAEIGGTVVSAEMLSPVQVAQPPRTYDRWRNGATMLDLIGGVCPGRCGSTGGGDHVHGSNLAGTNVSMVTLGELAGWELVHRVVWDGER